ncbi:hypothetical protein SIN8267_03492 [Sinobacterium norvegicum]|uniref:Z-ring associated protein G n=1 Tax=Sinobacterium norvegicum TaxID=1641715 RepID=A0ABM9AJY2_9GAMM|nr:YhcB family protein [Sinobacterium norvegicum]CAH0993344.1 hypothetical protein SIN8267_03492 [Sinobacterium norvegicum]
MFSTFEAIIIAALFALIGAIIGAFASSRLSSGSRANNDLSDELANTKKELDEYQQQVEDHFLETAKLVDELTKSYRDVHNHLAQGASELLNEEIIEQPLKKIQGPEDQQDVVETTETAGFAPLDYAPKDPKTKSGVLDEGFGLQKTASER